MNLKLSQHNQEAYNQVVTMFTNKGMTAIIHLKGTCTSFIAFHFVDDYQDWKICWVSLSDYIFKVQLDNIKKVKKDISRENVTFMIYSKLMYMTDEEVDMLESTLIILDEFHRAGATEWSKGVNRLLGFFPEVKLLGLSATHIYYPDNQRDMADELFKWHITSQMSLGEALVRGILSMPLYVVSLYSYEESLTNYTKCIDNTKNRNIKQKVQHYLGKLKKSLDKSLELQDIFTEYVKNKNGRYIAYCSNYDYMKEIVNCSRVWFSKIDPEAHFYQAYSNDPTTSVSFEQFQVDMSDYLKILFCIDMLNEGIHIENIGGVILFRPTSSPVIYKQQIVMATSILAVNMSIIFDIVNSFESLHSIDIIREEMQSAIDYYQMIGELDEIQVDEFEIIDVMKKCLELFSALEETLNVSWGSMYEKAREYFDMHHHLVVPKSYKTNEGDPLGYWISTQRQVCRGICYCKLNEVQIRKLNEIGMVWDYHDYVWNMNYQSAAHYYHKHDNLKISVNYVDENGIRTDQRFKNIKNRYNKHNGESLTSEQVHQLKNIGMTFRSSHDENLNCAYRYAKANYKKHHHLNVPMPDGFRLGRWISEQLTNTGKTSKKHRLFDQLGMNWKVEGI